MTAHNLDKPYTSRDEFRNVVGSVEAPLTLSSIYDRWEDAEEVIADFEAQGLVEVIHDKRPLVKWTGPLVHRSDSGPRISWSVDLIREQAVSLRAKKWTWEKIGRHLGRDERTIREYVKGRRRV